MNRDEGRRARGLCYWWMRSVIGGSAAERASVDCDGDCGASTRRLTSARRERDETTRRVYARMNDTLAASPEERPSRAFALLLLEAGAPPARPHFRPPSRVSPLSPPPPLFSPPLPPSSPPSPLSQPPAGWVWRTPRRRTPPCHPRTDPREADVPPPPPHPPSLFCATSVSPRRACTLTSSPREAPPARRVRSPPRVRYTCCTRFAPPPET